MLSLIPWALPLLFTMERRQFSGEAARKFSYKLTFKFFRAISISLKEYVQFLLLGFAIFTSYFSFFFKFWRGCLVFPYPN
jgi:hypothetical protein